MTNQNSIDSLKAQSIDILCDITQIDLIHHIDSTTKIVRKRKAKIATSTSQKIAKINTREDFDNVDIVQSKLRVASKNSSLDMSTILATIESVRNIFLDFVKTTNIHDRATSANLFSTHRLSSTQITLCYYRNEFLISFKRTIDRNSLQCQICDKVCKSFDDFIKHTKTHRYDEKQKIGSDARI